MATETEYVDAGYAIDFRYLSAGYVGSAPAVARGVTYERIVNGRDAEAHNWLTYYGAYDGQRYSLLDQIDQLADRVEVGYLLELAVPVTRPRKGPFVGARRSSRWPR